MLEIKVEAQELYNSKTNEFLNVPSAKLQLEHSLISLYKWESKWHKPFIGKEKTIPEIKDYIRCMTLNKGVDPLVYEYLHPKYLIQIIDYIKDPMTATTFHNTGRLIGAQRSSGETITAEIIYYWMISLNVPVEFEKWHLERLLTLIKVVNLKSGPKEKMSKKEAALQRAELNAQRRAKFNTKG